jgi:hypothetical protein
MEWDGSYYYWFDCLSGGVTTLHWTVGSWRWGLAFLGQRKHRSGHGCGRLETTDWKRRIVHTYSACVGFAKKGGEGGVVGMDTMK